MEITVARRPSLAHCTIGDLSVDGEPECVTLEDVVRERPGVPVSEWKIPNETAIPAGRYKVVVNHSAHFGRDLPQLLDVPGYEGVRIHPGNTVADTEGCVLVGAEVIGESVVESRVAFGKLFTKIQAAIQEEGEVWIALSNA